MKIRWPGHALATRVVPRLAGLFDSLDAAGSRILDVGTGVAAIAVALAREFPRAHVLGIDMLDRVLDLARIETAKAGEAGERVSPRRLDVAEVTEHSAFDTDRMAEALTSSGLQEVQRFPTVTGGPVLVAARRPRG
ncbi:methyltransferase domain-containing protein [Streptosporangium sp. NPDC023963]|uniref:methyltransferase domain-containing protein n=1 Tax=Streptosporangium sp. NPDC023963 TaxID=3155608 RepID=UPI003431FC17